jgi:hypothetical protein
VAGSRRLYADDDPNDVSPVNLATLGAIAMITLGAI